MNRHIHKYETFEEMDAKFHELLDQGIAKEQMTLYGPNPNHHFDELMDARPSWVRLFTLIGAVSGCTVGVLMCGWMSAVSWMIQTGNKGYFTFPPFIVIMFELTILLGALATMGGFLFLGRLPNPMSIIAPEDFENYFTIVVADDDQKAQQ